MAKKQPVAKRRQKRRARKKGMGVAVAFFCTVVTVAALMCATTVFFRIENIRVTGDSPYTAEKIISATGLQPGDSLIFFEKNGAVARLFDACPYLDTVRIHRIYPDTLEILVTESKPMAVVESGGAGYIISTKGKILEKIPQSGRSDLCHVTGTELKDPMIGENIEFSAKETKKPFDLALNTFLENDILKEIGLVRLDELYDITFTYTDRFRVKVGTAEDLDRKLRYMHALIERLSTTATGTIDVSDLQTARFIPD